MEKDKGGIMDTSIIIAHHTGKLIYRCLESLKDTKGEKIVVTTDQTFNKPIDVKCISLAPIPVFNKPTFKRNLGVKNARGKYVAFLDDDLEVSKSCISRMEKYLEDNPKVGMVYALLYKMDDPTKVDTSGSWLTWAGFLYEKYENNLWKSPYPVLSAKSACCMIRKDLFWQVGGFDENFVIYGEETDLSWRVWQSGYRVELLPNALGYHAFETSLKPRTYYNQEYIHYHGCKNYVTTLLKNLPKDKMYIAWINFLVWGIVGCAFLFKNRQASRWIFKGLRYVLKNRKYIMNKRIGEGFYSKEICCNPPISYYFKRFKDYLIHQLHG